MVDYLFIDFANSELYDGHGNVEDLLDEESWRRPFLDKWGIANRGPLGEPGRRQLTTLRDAIRSISERLRIGERPSARDMGILNAALESRPVRFELAVQADVINLVEIPLKDSGSETLEGEIALSMARFLAGAEIDRLKMCDNAGCRWVFHDDTKNRSRKWCRVCGNVDKVRRFRERQRAERARSAVQR